MVYPAHSRRAGHRRALLLPQETYTCCKIEQACFVCAQPPAAAGGGGQAGPLDFLRSNPQFQALRSIVQSHPAILQPMLQARGPLSARAVQAKRLCGCQLREGGQYLACSYKRICQEECCCCAWPSAAAAASALCCCMLLLAGFPLLLCC